MLVYKHSDCLLKDNGFNHPERKERIDSILESIEQIDDILTDIQNLSSDTPGGMVGYLSGSKVSDENKNRF